MAAAVQIRGRQVPSASPAVPCASLQAPTVPGATVTSIQAAEVRNFTMPSFGGSGLPGTSNPGNAAPLSFCDVNVTLTHGNDSVRIEVWLPLTGWNGRFQGTGGGGFIAGTFASAMAPEVAAGYAAASTDAGLQPMSFDSTGIQFDQQLLTNFASLSVHEMALVGKNLTQAFYGKPASFSYWNGCSTGGRQGYMEAQQYPNDFDGILAAAPAINWAKFVPSEMWPFVVQNSGGQFIPDCVLDMLIANTIKACDNDDGVQDGIISDPLACQPNTTAMINTNFNCQGSSGKVTQQHVDMYNKILAGPAAQDGTQLWFGFLPGTNTTMLTRQSRPFSLASGWFDNLVAKADVAQRVTMTNFTGLFSSSEAQFGALLDTDNPDLTAFRNAGGKLLTWQGLSDQLIPPQGTINYRQKVEALMGGGANVDSFYRLFFAPGVMHCAGGNGAQPVSVLDTLVNWVEKGAVPDTLPAKTFDAKTTRNICRYPLVQKYSGSGDVNSAASWTCIEGGVRQQQTTAGDVSSSANSGGAGSRTIVRNQVLPFAFGLITIALGLLLL